MLSGSKKRKPTRDTVHKVSNAATSLDLLHQNQLTQNNNNNNKIIEDIDCKSLLNQPTSAATMTSASSPSPRTSPLPAALAAVNALKNINNGKFTVRFTFL